MNTPRLALATTVWKRPELTRIVLAYYGEIRRRLADQIDLVLLAVGSEGAHSRKPCEEAGFHYIEHENEPVTYKWNRVIQEAQRYSPEGMVLVNSDDLVSMELFPAFLDCFRRGLDYVGLKGTDIIDLMSLQFGTWPGYEASFMKFRIGEPAGCGRGFSKRLLEKTNWRLWPPVPKKNSSMDFWCTQFVKLWGFEPRAFTMAELGVRAVQIKTDCNITTLNRLPLTDVGRGEQAFHLLEGIVGPEFTEQFRDLQRELAPAPGHAAPYHYSSASRDPIHSIEEIPVSPEHGCTVTWMKAMREAVLGEERP
ncbi:MAG: hypothetical protein HKN82_01420 [Akkermansiaceae bacterium]|nr:hypothetical protein [Akkermansiaceae bacterium]NNM28328.1 hypothetical protein [Akkermansiaceae bacterium]